MNKFEAILTMNEFFLSVRYDSIGNEDLRSKRIRIFKSEASMWLLAAKDISPLLEQRCQELKVIAVNHDFDELILAIDKLKLHLSSNQSSADPLLRLDNLPSEKPSQKTFNTNTPDKINWDAVNVAVAITIGIITIFLAVFWHN